MDETPEQELERLRQLELHVSDFLWAVDNEHFRLYLSGTQITVRESVFVTTMRQFVRRSER